MKIPVFETPSLGSTILCYCEYCTRLSVYVQIMVFRHLLRPSCQFVAIPQKVIGFICVVSLVIPSLSLITIIRHDFDITPRLFGICFIIRTCILANLLNQITASYSNLTFYILEVLFYLNPKHLLYFVSVIIVSSYYNPINDLCTHSYEIAYV